MQCCIVTSAGIVMQSNDVTIITMCLWYALGAV